MNTLSNDKMAWKIKPLLITHVIALLLLTSWIFEPTRSLWLIIDDAAFWFFNDSLKNGGDTYRYFWALVNMQEFDKVVALLLLGIFVVHGLQKGKPLWGRHFGILVAIFIVLGIWTGYGNHTGVGQLLPFERPSATLEYPDSFRLAEWSTELKTKDASPDSFPGDHGMILLIFAGFVGYYFSRSYTWFAFTLAIIGTMPRVVAGAHWVTDEIVGAVFIAMLALSWNFHTPLGEFMVRISDKLFQKALSVLRLN
jgi:membrane-associated phospholipid phosphatase